LLPLEGPPLSILFRRSAAVLLCSALLAASSASAQNVPVADAGDDQLIDCAPPSGAQVTLDGSGSSDADAGAVLTYTWTGAALAQPVLGATPSVLLPPGTNVLTLTVADGVDGSSSDDVTVTVIADETPPVLVLDPDSDELWPPNHKLHGYRAADLVESVSDDCTELQIDDVVFARGTSDEPDETIGDGNFPDDIAFFENCSEAELRAERAGPRDGRVYQLFLRATDDAGNATEAPFTVSVPHDRAHGAVDSGVDHEVECEGAHCEPAPDPSCTNADAGAVSIAEGTKGPGLRWNASGFAAGAVSASNPALCLYVDDAAASGSLDPDKVRVRAKKGQGALYVATRGADLEIPALPLPNGAVLRLELHGGADECVASSFDQPSVNEPGAYQATD
jgi:hypothetical protein